MVWQGLLEAQRTWAVRDFLKYTCVVVAVGACLALRDLILGVSPGFWETVPAMAAGVVLTLAQQRFWP